MFDKTKKSKSRKIPLMEYYEILQLEFLSYYFRYLFYTRDEDKSKYLDFCKKKKESIEKLSLRNSFHSIFNDDKYKEKYFKKFFNTQGLPNLSYRDNYQKTHLGFWDKKYFFDKDIEVEYRGSLWIILENQCKFVEITSDGENELSDFIQIKRLSKPLIKVSITEVSRNVEDLFNLNIF